MGLFSRRRSARAADQSPTPDVEQQPESVPDHRPTEVYRASSLSDVPEWAKVPPPQSVLPEMPVVVSTHFDRSLASWQPPERFLDTLGHTVSPEGPSGLVEGIAVLAPPPVAPPEGGESAVHAGEGMPLAPAAQRSPEGGTGARIISTKRIPFGPDRSANQPGLLEAPSPVVDNPLPLAAPAPPPVEPAPSAIEPAAPTFEGEAQPDAEAPSEAPAVEPPSAGLIGAAPITPVVQPLVAMEPLQPGPSHLVHAAAPPDMPLANLPSAPLPPGSELRPAPMGDRSARSPEAEPGSDLATSDSAGSGAVGDSGLVGDAPIVQTRLDTAAPAAPSPPAPVPPAPDLPLASGAERSGGADTPAPTIRRLENPFEMTAEAAVGEPTLAEASPEADQPVAPLVGLAAPLAAETAPPAQAETPDASPVAQPEQPLPVQRSMARSGLGEPMRSLPPTAVSWDVSTMTMDQQIRASRALIQSQMRSRGGDSRPGSSPLPLGAVPAPASVQRRIDPPERVFAGTPLRQAPIEPIGPPPIGIMPPGLPDHSGELAPLVSMDLPLSADATAPVVSDSSVHSEASPASVVSRRIDPALPAPAAVARAEVPTGIQRSPVPVSRSDLGGPGPVPTAALSWGNGVPAMPTVSRLAEAAPDSRLELLPSARLPETRMFAAQSAPAGLGPAEAGGTELALSAAMPRRAPLPPPGDGGPAAGISPYGGGQPVQTLPLAAPSAVSLNADALVETVLQRMSGLTTSFPGGVGSEAATQIPATTPQQITIQREAAPAEPQAWVSDTPSASSGPEMQRPSDAELSNLSRWLYPLIKHRLKGDLREDRERAGLLTDHYRKW